MKKILSITTLLSLLPMVALAAVVPDLDVLPTLENILNWLFTILLIVAAIFIVVAAYFFVTAQGDPDQVKKARNFVLYALIGVLVAFLARGLVLLVGQIVGVPIVP